MTKTSLRWGTLALAVATLAGCATTENALKDANTLLEERETDKLLPVTNLSPYALALRRFGRMLDIYEVGDPVIYMQTRSILEAAGIHAPAGVIGPVRGRPLLHGLEALAQRLLQPQDVLDQRVLTLVTPVFPDQLRQHDQHHHQHDQGADRQPYQIAPGLVAFPFHHIPQLTTCAL